ncbi:btk-binding protein-related [Anaeramoeba flamelloides]|uniref:Btk-binding protein-related n=1 Tax=Anaeramoeba flamelloides TaxID=1746091 RepID=A0ABQ8XRP0_9EUKA|nr:btk-binding protein-related [Anaeramoeba flamelloides]
MSNESSLYLTGVKGFSFVTKKKNNNLPKWTSSKIKKTQTIKKIVGGSQPRFLVWKKPNKLEFYEKDEKKREYQLPKKEAIKDIYASVFTYLILTESGKVWSLAYSNRHSEVPLLDADQSTFEEIRHVTFFEEKKLFVNSLRMGFGSVYYLCNGDQLYVSGSNSQGRLGLGKKGGKEPMPVYLQDKVTKIFAGIYATNFFFITSKPDLLYGCGCNKYGKLGVGFTGDLNSPTAVKNFQGSEILAVSSCGFHSILITKKGQTFGCGNQRENGLGVNKSTFTLIPQLKEKKAVQLETGSAHTLVLTDQNELYGWAFSEELFPTNESSNDKRFPTKISLPSFFTNYLDSKDMIRIACGSRALVECRTKLTIDQIQRKLFGEKSTTNKEQTLCFLKWVYYDEISDQETLEQTFDSLELTFPPSVDNTLEKDIAQLYKDDDSKDFKILVEIDDEEEDEDEENKDFNYEEIPVHKFILLARSGLFRAMFDNVNEKDNTNKVQDYSHKTIESLEILIKYFYTNSIEMTADEDPELIVDELSDAVEYYQLNDQCNLDSELMKIKKQFNLN